MDTNITPPDQALQLLAAEYGAEHCNLHEHDDAWLIEVMVDGRNGNTTVVGKVNVLHVHGVLAVIADSDSRQDRLAQAHVETTLKNFSFA